MAKNAANEVMEHLRRMMLAGDKTLARRLARRGLVLSGEAVAVLLSQNASAAFVPPALVSATVKAASFLAIGQTAAISAKIVAITQGVLTSMLLSKLKTVAVVSFLCVIGLGLGARYLAGQTPGDSQQQSERKSIGEAKAQNPGEKKKNDSDPKLDTKELEKLLIEEVEKQIQKTLSAQTQRQNAAKWEYQVVTFHFNEDVGLVGTLRQPSPGSANMNGAVAFKRLKN